MDNTVIIPVIIHTLAEGFLEELVFIQVREKY